MNSLVRVKPTSRITVLHAPTAIRWDLWLLAALALIGLLAPPAPRG